MIIRLNHYITAKECAKKYGLKTRTIHDQMRRKDISFATICGTKMVVENAPRNPPDVSVSSLQLVKTFARLHKYSPDTIYQNIIRDKINAVVIGNLVLVNPEEQSVIDFLKNNPPAKRK
jgi:hypothetical protein